MKDLSFKDYILDQLLEIKDVRAIKMFGSFGLYAGENFFGIISDGVLYLKTNAKTKQKFVSFGMKPFTPSAKQILKNYFEVPEEVIDDREELCNWVVEAIEVGM